MWEEGGAGVWGPGSRGGAPRGGPLRWLALVTLGSAGPTLRPTARWPELRTQPPASALSVQAVGQGVDGWPAVGGKSLCKCLDQRVHGGGGWGRRCRRCEGLDGRLDTFQVPSQCSTGVPDAGLGHVLSQAAPPEQPPQGET